MTWSVAGPCFGIYLTAAGLMFGSFINLAADRVPRGESIVAPGSHCRACGRRLNVVDLLPVLGYLLRSGRCATCRAEIGAAAPLVELVSGLLVALPILAVGVWPGAALGAALLAGYALAAVGLAVLRRPDAAPLS